MKTNLHGSIIVTYRCNARCNMCNVWQFPNNVKDEIDLDTVEKLPEMFFANITGGEPFIRRDLPEIISLVRRKARRIVISSNGFFTQRIIALFEKYPDLGIRISVEGLPKTNDAIRGIPDGFDRTLRTLLALRDMGIRDIGFGMTIQDLNAKDLIPLYRLAEALGYEFATATLHNSHYFQKLDNHINDVDAVSAEIEKLIFLLLKSRKIKEWFRAYFNYGLMHFIHGNPRLLPCEMGRDGFFLYPFGNGDGEPEAAELGGYLVKPAGRAGAPSGPKLSKKLLDDRQCGPGHPAAAAETRFVGDEKQDAACPGEKGLRAIEIYVKTVVSG